MATVTPFHEHEQLVPLAMHVPEDCTLDIFKDNVI